jgi:hypothetical protein
MKPNEQQLFYDKCNCSLLTYNFSSRTRPLLETTLGSCRQLTCSHKPGLNKLAWRTQYSPHITSTIFIWSGPEWFLLIFSSQSKTQTNSAAWRGPVFRVHARDFDRHRPTGTWCHISWLGGPCSRSKWMKWRLRHILNNFHIYYFGWISSDGAGAYSCRPEEINCKVLSFLRFWPAMFERSRWIGCHAHEVWEVVEALSITDILTPDGNFST